MSSNAKPVQTIPAKLAGLSVREAISDVLLRACAGLDDKDAALWQSAWASSDDISFAIDDGPALVGKESVFEHLLPAVAHVDLLHMVSNIRISLSESGNEATLSANSVTHHSLNNQGQVAGAPRFVRGARQRAALIKQSGDWKLVRCEVRTVWSEGDPSIMQPPQ